MLVPEDRKALFAFVSLLVEPASLPPGVLLTAANFLQFVPRAHAGLVEALADRLLYDC